jgi:exosortase C (VPDSG-CTERM-specific)
MDDYLAVMGWSFVLLFVAGVLLFCGKATAKYFAFPLAFLVFAAPFPKAMMDAILAWLQHGSAEVAYAMLSLSGMPTLKQGTFFQLPGFDMQVAPECSGIHSTLVLFITSLVAGQLMLKTQWRRAVLVLAVIPLALLRNGLRIFTIGQLCVQVSPDMIHSYIHRKGGPIFFALSLIPFLILLIWLRKSELRSLRGRGEGNSVKA